MKVYIVGEDDATKEIIRKIINYCGNKIEIITELPARGGQLKSKIKEFNVLSKAFPVILLTDLDNNDCPTTLIKSWNIVDKNDKFMINIAVDEAEAWLMADRESFAKYFHVKEDLIPTSHKTKLNGPHYTTEMNFPYKASLYLNSKIIPESTDMAIRQQMLPTNGSVKGREYNVIVIPYIKKHWNIDKAISNSDSLRRMVNKIKEWSEL